MPDIIFTTVLASILVLMVVALPFVAARLPRSRRISSHDIEQSGPGPGFTYALVPPGGHPDQNNGDQKGTWQWCLAFIPEETADGGSEMPPWWAPAPPWDATAKQSENFTHDADALMAMFDETSAQPVARSARG